MPAGEPVGVDMRICRAGAGFYVTAAVAATLVLQCDCCPRVFQHPVRGDFQVLAGVGYHPDFYWQLRVLMHAVPHLHKGARNHLVCFKTDDRRAKVCFDASQLWLNPASGVRESADASEILFSPTDKVRKPGKPLFAADLVLRTTLRRKHLKLQGVDIMFVALSLLGGRKLGLCVCLAHDGA